jgi:hypothetical protein
MEASGKFQEELLSAQEESFRPSRAPRGGGEACRSGLVAPVGRVLNLADLPDSVLDALGRHLGVTPTPDAHEREHACGGECQDAQKRLTSAGLGDPDLSDHLAPSFD